MSRAEPAWCRDIREQVWGIVGCQLILARSPTGLITVTLESYRRVGVAQRLALRCLFRAMSAVEYKWHSRRVLRVVIPAPEV